MLYQTSDITKAVRIALDRNDVGEALAAVGDVDTLTLDEIVLSKIEGAVRFVESQAPVHLLEPGGTFGSAVHWETSKTGWTLLPSDFMRLMAFRMSDWERTVYEAICADDASYGVQSSRYGGLRGNYQRPVCAVVMRPEGLALEFFSCRDNTAKVEQAVYRRFPKIDAFGGIEISERLHDASIYAAAADVAMALEATQQAQLLTQMAKQLMV